MSLQDVSLPKKYKDGDVLFEQTLDAWRQATEQAFATMNLNFTQLAKDIFPSDYDYNNDGNQTESKSLQEQITDVITGATPITGTSADSFTINTDGNSSTLTTASLSAIRTHALPDISGTFMMLEGAQTVSGAKTFASATFNVLGIKIKGAGVGVASLQYANSADSRDYTIPDAGAAADFVMTAGPQTITGIKTFNVGTLKLGGAGVGIALLKNGNNTVDTTFQFPVLAAATYTIGIVGQLDWDTAWLDAVHNHSSDAEGGAIPWASITPDPNLTYDDVAESISQVWDFTVGAQLGQIRIVDNDIYERDTDSDTGRLRFNYYSYNGGLTRRRDASFYDGHGSLIFDINRATRTYFLLSTGFSIVSVKSPAPYDTELASLSAFFTAPSIYNDPETSCVNSDGDALKADAHVTTRSLSKGWASFKLTDDDPPVIDTIYKGYNLGLVAPITVSATYVITIDWKVPFADANYVVVANCYAGEYQSGDAPNYCDGDNVQIVEKTTGSVKIIIRDDNDQVDWESTRNARIDLVAFGDLAS